jgi:hypothetical protein
MIILRIDAIVDYQSAMQWPSSRLNNQERGSRRRDDCGITILNRASPGLDLVATVILVLALAVYLS